MISLSIVLDGDGAWPDMENAPEARMDAVARLTRGTVQGESTVGFRIVMPDGKLVFAQTTMRLFLAAADAFKVVESGQTKGELH